MPVDYDCAFASRALRDRPSFVPPLPRLTPKFEPQGDEEKYEVLVVGAGPSGLMLTLLLARYGLSDESLLCIDAKDGALRAGQADALHPRTLEVFKSLGLADEILNDGSQLWEVALWNPRPGQEDVIEQTSIMPTVAGAARYPFDVCLHQGRIERIFETDLLCHSERGIQRSTKLIDLSIDNDPEFPVRAEIESNDQHRTVRCKYLVGADGAHSTVRRCLGLELEGESLGYMWGVVDLVIESDFPDIRRLTTIHSIRGSALVVPREQIQTGEYLTRLYIQIPGEEDLDSDLETVKAKRNQITLESILESAKAIFQPYNIRLKPGGTVDWWAVYHIGQRLLNDFTIKDSAGTNRVFLVGDACHTHSPNAGQGMNVSMMDSYNLAWKLAHSIHGVTPEGLSYSFLDTYHSERRTVAQQLIDNDRQLTMMVSGKVATAQDVNGYTNQQFIDLLNTKSGFMSGHGIEYVENLIVEMTPDSKNPVCGTDYLSGILRPGTRMANVKLKRYADGAPRDIQDDFPSTGRFRILVLASTDLLEPQGISSRALRHIGSMLLPSFPHSLVEQVVLHPRIDREFRWEDMPGVVKYHSEMRFYNGCTPSDAYKLYGVDPDAGALAVVRPDGYVGAVARLEDMGRIEEYLARCLKRVPSDEI